MRHTFNLYYIASYIREKTQYICMYIMFVNKIQRLLMCPSYNKVTYLTKILQTFYFNLFLINQSRIIITMYNFHFLFHLLNRQITFNNFGFEIISNIFQRINN